MQKSIQAVVNALLDLSKPFSPKYLHRFSDLSPDDVVILQKNWEQIPLPRKQALLSDLQEILDADTLVNFDALAEIGINDKDQQVQLASIRLLEYCEDTRLVPRYLSIIKSDPDEKVRSEVVSALGNFVYRGELEEIPARIYNQILAELLSLMTGKESEFIRRRALESLSYSCHDEVPAMIEKAFTSKEKAWKVSALLSMGRSADERWHPQVLEMLDSTDLELKSEAIQAAGELELKAAQPILFNILSNVDAEPEIQTATAWALSKIGGESVRALLEKRLDEAVDDDEVEFYEEALDNLSFSEGYPLNDMLDVGIQDEEELDSFIDLEAEEDNSESDDDES